MCSNVPKRLQQLRTQMENSNRRSFLKTGATAAGLSLARPASANNRIRAAVVGCRGRGWDLMKVFHELSTEDNVELAALCEVDDSVLNDRLKTLENLSGKRPQTYSDIRKLLEDKSIDVVAHSTPNH